MKLSTGFVNSDSVTLGAPLALLEFIMPADNNNGDEAAAAPPPQEILQNVPFPHKLELTGTKEDMAESWTHFKNVWKHYEIASRLRSHSGEVRLATMLSCFNKDAFKIYNNAKWENDGDENDIKKVTAMFDAYCIGEVNEIYERYVFNKRVQQQGETVDSFVTSLFELAKNCQFEHLHDSLIRDRIVIATNNRETRKKLLGAKNLTLKRAINVARSQEVSDKAENEMDGKEEEVHAIRSMRKEVRECKFCDFTHRMVKEDCPAWGKRCAGCGDYNHFVSKCPNPHSKKPPKKHRSYKKKQHAHVDYVDGKSSSGDEYQPVFTLEDATADVNSVNASKLYAKMMICGEKDINFQMDCGAEVNILPLSLYNNISSPKKPPLCPSKTLLRMYNGAIEKPEGKVSCKTINLKNGKKYLVEYQVVAGDQKPILGSRAIQSMKLMSVNMENVLAVTSENLAEEYADVFDGGLGRFEGKVKLEIDPSIQPVRMPARKLPLALKGKVKEHIHQLVDKKVLIPVSTPTDWTSSMVIVKKNNGKIRLCIDPKPLNNALKRNQYPLPTLDDVLPELSNAKFFTVADVQSGYWHCEMTEESSFLSTFATPFGRFRWARLPFGLKPSGDEFQRKLSENLEGLEGIKAVADDIIVWGESEAEHDRRVRALLQRCRERGIKLNYEKLKHKQTEVEYMGHRLTDQGLKADPEKLKAIQEMPAPTDKEGVMRILGTCNYLQQFAPHLSDSTAPLRELLKKDVEFMWDTPQQRAYEEVKQKLSSPPVLRYFDPKLTTTLQCDASQKGLGASILQGGQPVAMASRALTPTEQNYAQIEKELLAIVFGMEKFEQYTYGRKIMVESDHKPLEAITRKALSSAPKRLQRMMLRLQRYDIDVIYKKGKHMFIADTLSRAYLQNTKGSSVENDVESIHMIDYVHGISDGGVTKIKEATQADAEMLALIKVIQTGWPESQDELPIPVKDYYTFRDELSVQNGLIYKGERLVVPTAIRPEMIRRIHSSHLGIQSCLRRAREAVYWPLMNGDVTAHVSACTLCKDFQTAQQKEPLISHETPNGPWQKVGVDLFEVDGIDYMVTVDYYSGFFELDRLMVNKKADEVITKIKAHFARHGIPSQVMTDNGPPFNSLKFDNFALLYEFEHLTSSPRYPQSNGKAESAVKIAGSLIKRAHKAGADVHLALLDYYNTPTEGMESSPAQRLYSRRTKTLLPTSSRLLRPEIQQNVHKRILQKKMKYQHYYNTATKELDPLLSGELVRIQDRNWQRGTVAKQCDIRSYEVRTEDGGRYRRNRRFLRRTNEQPPKLPTDISLGTRTTFSGSRNNHWPTTAVEQPTGEPPASVICDKTQNPDGNDAALPVEPRPTRARISTKDTIYKDFV